MPYSMQIYPGDADQVPSVGDKFIVTEVLESFDLDWGECVFVRMKPIDDQFCNDSPNYGGQNSAFIRKGFVILGSGIGGIRGRLCETETGYTVWCEE